MTHDPCQVLTVTVTKTAKHQIHQRALMEAKIVPHHPSISVFSGSQGSGKTTLVLHMLKSPELFCGYFDVIFLLIGSDDDMYDSIIAKEGARTDKTRIIAHNHVVRYPDPEDIQKIIDTQKMAIEAAPSIDKSPKILIIMDDLANNGRLLRSKPFLQLFVAGRHLNSSTWFLSQYLNLVTKSARLQANYLYVFKSNRAEMKVLSDQWQPPDMTKKEFDKMVMNATRDGTNPDGSRKVNFLSIVKGVADNKRFRQNLDAYIVLPGHERPNEKPIVMDDSSSDSESSPTLHDLPDKRSFAGGETPSEPSKPVGSKKLIMRPQGWTPQRYPSKR